MGSKKQMKNTKRMKNYVDKTLEYCLKNNIDLKKVFKKSISKYETNVKDYETLKKNFNKEKRYIAEREKIALDSKDYKTRLKKIKKNYDKKFQQSIIDKIGKGKNAKLLWNNRHELGLTKGEMLSSNLMEIANNRVAEKMKKDIQDQITLEKRKFDEKGVMSKDVKQIGGFFKNRHENRFVHTKLSELYDMIRNDKNAFVNVQKAINHLYDKILVQHYEGDNAEYGKRRHADNKFWESVSTELIDYYKSKQIPIE